MVSQLPVTTRSPLLEMSTDVTIPRCFSRVSIDLFGEGKRLQRGESEREKRKREKSFLNKKIKTSKIKNTKINEIKRIPFFFFQKTKKKTKKKQKKNKKKTITS